MNFNDPDFLMNLCEALKKVQDGPKDVRATEELPELLIGANPEEYLNWERQIDQMFGKRRNELDDKRRCKFAISRLGSGPSLWYGVLKNERIRLGKKKITSWESLKRKLRKRYVPFNHSFTNFHEFEQEKLVVGEYIVDFEELSLMGEIEEVEEEKILVRCCKCWGYGHSINECPNEEFVTNSECNFSQSDTLLDNDYDSVQIFDSNDDEYEDNHFYDNDNPSYDDEHDNNSFVDDNPSYDDGTPSYDDNGDGNNSFDDEVDNPSFVDEYDGNNSYDDEHDGDNYSYECDNSYDHYSYDDDNHSPVYDESDGEEEEFVEDLICSDESDLDQVNNCSLITNFVKVDLVQDLSSLYPSKYHDPYLFGFIKEDQKGSGFELGIMKDVELVVGKKKTVTVWVESVTGRIANLCLEFEFVLPNKLPPSLSLIRGNDTVMDTLSRNFLYIFKDPIRDWLIREANGGDLADLFGKMHFKLGLKILLPIPIHPWEDISMEFILALFRGKDTIMVFVERFPDQRKNKIMSRVEDSYKILARINDEVYKIAFVSVKFKIGDFFLYFNNGGNTELRTIPFKGGGDDTLTNGQEVVLMIGNEAYEGTMARGVSLVTWEGVLDQEMPLEVHRDVPTHTSPQWSKKNKPRVSENECAELTITSPQSRGF